MADLDLADILADGDYLKRVGDVLVGAVPASGGTPEDIVDTVAAALVDGTGIDVVYDDTANTITVNSTAQPASAALTDLTTKWVPAAATTQSTLKFAEGTNNGTNTLTLAPSTASFADVTVTIPAANGQVVLLANTATLTNKTIALGSNTVTGTFAEFNTACTDADFVRTTRTITTYSAVSNTAVIGDAGCYVRFTGTNPTYTIPPNSAVAFPVGTVIAGIGATTAMTLIAGAGVTLVKARTLVTTGAGSAWTAIKVATDTFDLAGDFV